MFELFNATNNNFSSSTVVIFIQGTYYDLLAVVMFLKAIYSGNKKYMNPLDWFSAKKYHKM